MNEHGFDCREIAASLPLFAAGELEAAAHSAVERHVAGCAPCRGRAAAATRARVALIEGGRAAAAPDLWPAVQAELSRLDLLSDPGRRASPRAPSRPTLVRPLGFAAAAAMLLALGIWLGRGLGAPEAPPDAGSGLVENQPTPSDEARPHGTPEDVEDALSPRSDAAAGTLVADQEAATPHTQPSARSGLRRLEPGEAPLHAQAELEVFIPERQGPGRWLRLPADRGEQPASLIEAGPAIR